MFTEYRYIFEKGSKKHQCPDCTKKRFVRYIDTETNEYLPELYGRCDREIKCGYLLNPYKDGYAKAIWKQDKGNKTDWKPQRQKPKKKPLNKSKRAYVPIDVLKQTCAGYEQNIFIQNLLTRVAFPFEVQDIEKVITLYHLGTVQNGYSKGANTFPFIDLNNNVRAVQVKQFDQKNHTTGTDFLHSIIEKRHTQNNKPLPDWLVAYNKNEKKVSCLFGEHLLSKYPHNPIALVEAPKTAIYGTLYFGFPEQPTNFLWLAVYNLSSLTLSKCRTLKGRNVFLFPDLNAYDKWKADSEKIQQQLKDTHFEVSDLLEKLASQRDKDQGKDIADYLIKQDWRLFRKQGIKEAPQSEPEGVENPTREKSEKSVVLNKTIFSHNDQFEQPKKEEQKNWDKDIAELENYFANIKLPTKSIKLNRCSTIINCSLFVESHFATVKANNGKRTFLPYLHRLLELKEFLNS